MLFYLQSTDPNDYGTLKLQTNLGLQNEPLAFRVLDFSTIASFVITDTNDFITFEIDGISTEIHFKARNKYDIDTLEKKIQDLIDEKFNGALNCELTDSGIIKFSSEKEFKITDMTHRARLLLGAYHQELPLKSSIENQKYIIEMKSAPYICYGNCLYVESKISNVTGISGVNNKNSVIEYKSFCYAVNSVFMPNFPILLRHEGKWVRIQPHHLKDMTFRLVDFQGEPIEIKAPVQMTIEVDFWSNIRANGLDDEPGSRYAAGLRP